MSTTKSSLTDSGSRVYPVVLGYCQHPTCGKFASLRRYNDWLWSIDWLCFACHDAYTKADMESEL